VGWTLTEHPLKTFGNNSLAAVVVQLRFHPILKTAEYYAEFQEKIRPRFPGYEEVETQTVEMTFDAKSAPASIVRSAKVHRFLAVNEPTVATLETTAVTIEYAAHKNRATLIEDFNLVVEALNVYRPVPVRLGLRYVNVIEKHKLEEYFKKEMNWSELLAPTFATVPGGLAMPDADTHYLVEATSPRDQGKMTVRYGLLMPPGAKEQHFRLDTDRFFEGSVNIDQCTTLLKEFSEDIFQVFMMAAGPKLIEWMESTK
jgi:uncharacterized protein (TIGR04255 family)